MLSKKLESLVATIEAATATVPQQEAAANLRDALRECATRQACYRCDRAGFIIGWDAKQQRWGAVLVSCSAFHALPQGEWFGLESPSEFLFCTAETNSTTDAGPASFGDDL